MARALYIHWPFCLAKCPYCDFNSHVRDSVDHAAWETALLADLRHEAELAGGEPLDSIFFGGGTPSLMPPALVARLLAEAERLWGFVPGIEITLEGNPSSVEAANYAALATAGVNRASLGLQALDDQTLRFLGRLHGAAEGLRAVETAQAVFDRVSFDLIYARPGQTVDGWERELDQALAIGTTHLSLYQLTIEPGTRFETMVRKGDFMPLDEDACADLFALTRERTASAGLPAYEISNHARPGEESRHNLAYWRYQDYVGIGPGAHGRRGGMATVRHKKPENWLAAVAANGHGLSEERVLALGEQASEALLMGLRLDEGIDLSALAKRFAMNADALIDHAKIAFYLGQGLVWQDGDRLGVTQAGMPLLDGLLAELVRGELVSA
ncbi:radical SAM family heme chaperone HemW [Novosphingobium sp.]|jgi:oxygen-independent coproporphyrinogen-3 oxidase|uniref:radical SAM family heme chaperone HemW n=1 Tax=Novosphingobium sp. TaxID=1874826 RepID=UPI0022CBC62B|nr:radical SAM family heme chaperone HemW [Novosphingobium sp.]MCZ8017310.1 radical SAM family heme chaperone HemW [Novosphingobium sp.]MCZ8034167.1 radical SAM family heme chaperone HemW [Novosphingobium sp.]MCZ8051522.1 radical SAM family heme chaperone HemW [Novosphingobium sp.]MCZ8059868.1 radical SAM family heme chaperone HemW [Novosphingobium sp.]MCZ8231706.1 radical SAM family heme chaperone HemW [Novosphingobium sp.]